jgi:tetratricopeptide (TPR) repeat protein
MDYSCLLIDLTASGIADQWQELLASQDMPMPVALAQSVEEAQAIMNSGAVLILGLFAKENSGDIQTLFKSYQANMGCISDFQAVICDDPDPVFMAGVFEYGIEQFFSMKTWPADLAALARSAKELAADSSSAESRTIRLTRSIRSADQVAIQNAEKELGDLAEHDYRAAFAKGKACEATGDYNGAASAYGSASGMNKLFRPTASSLGETLLVTGRVDEALEVFKKLEKTNPYDVERKANLAAAFIEKGDFESAQKYVDAAEKLAPNNSRVLEAKAQVFLCTGKVGDAFKLMDGMSEVGPFFAAKLNELGIKLSQTGKGKSALALYQKAHKIVRPDLRYKISLNAALACRRLRAWDMALKYLVRCEREYGSKYSKLDKIRTSIVEAMKAEKEVGAAPTQKVS